MKKKLSSMQEEQGNKAYNLVEMNNVKGTPFTIVQRENDKGNLEILVTMGNYVIKDKFKKVEDAEDYITDDSWELRLKAFAVYTQFINEIKK